ncbi:MAG: RDD family protein [Pelobium sp.]
MLFIFGTKSIGKTVQQGNFHCDRCEQTRTYNLKQYRKYFSIFFIPLIPLNRLGDTLECTFCKTEYIPNASIIPGYIASTITKDSLFEPIASIGKRLGSFVIDILFLTLLNFPLSFLAAKFGNYLPKNFIIVFYSFWFIYFFVMEWLFGGTIGKKILSIKIVSETEEGSVSVLQWFLRAIVKCVPLINIILLFNDKHKGVHDYVANTIVVEKSTIAKSV